MIHSSLKVNDGQVKRDRSGQHLRRLRKDFPSIHQQVIDGDKTVHEAAVEAGIYPARASVPLTVDGFARAASKHLTAEQRAELAGRARKKTPAIVASVSLPPAPAGRART